MGSQARWNAEHAAPAIVVVEVGKELHICERVEFGAKQVENWKPLQHESPVVVRYKSIRVYQHSERRAVRQAADLLEVAAERAR